MKSGIQVLSGLLTLVFFLSSSLTQGPVRVRTPVHIPDIPGFKTLKCDFHTHTVFSDGSVWPNIRAEEAWREGLDAIAITDHIEYQPHKRDLPTSHERSYEIAQPHGEMLDLIVIRGSEVTRDMPPGHLNAVFLDQVSPMDTEDWRDAVQKAKAQGAFVFWNHPGWQQSERVAKWHPDHTELIEGGMLHGIEVVNARQYYPEAHRWCIEKNLTMLANSDIHYPLNLAYGIHAGEHRPLTLVFAYERSQEAIREALFARRTAVYSGNTLVGEEKFLRPIFTRSLEITTRRLTLRGRRGVFVQIRNHSDIDYQLSGGTSSSDRVSVQSNVILSARKTSLLRLSGTARDRTGTSRVKVTFTADNLLVGPDVGLPVEFEFEVTLVPDED